MTLDLATLINTIIEEYKRRTGDEKLVEEFIEKVGKSGTYADVYALAKKAGLSLENAIIDAWTFDKNEVYFETIKQLLLKVTGPMHDDIAKACKHIQESMNAASGFKLKPQISEINGYDIDDIADRMKNQGITRIMGELQTLGCKIVDDTEQANMDMLTSSGYEIKIVRTYDDVGLTTGAGKKKDCQFCLDLEGEHEFYSTREARYSGVFSRHPKCGCTIDYTSKKTGKTDYNIQNFHSAKTPRITRDEETARNREMYEKAQEFYGSPKAREVIENIKRMKFEGVQNRGIYDQGRQIVIDKSQVKNVSRYITSEAYLATDSRYDIFISANSHLKLFGLRNIEKSIEKSIEMLEIDSLEGFPAIYVLTVEEMGETTFASYNPVKNELYISDIVGNKANTKKMQKQYGFAAANDATSTTRHELIHWKKARLFRKTKGNITPQNVKAYLKSLNNDAKIEISKLQIDSSEKAYMISKYAGDQYKFGNYDETLTEYLVGK